MFLMCVYVACLRCFAKFGTPWLFRTQIDLRSDKTGFLNNFGYTVLITSKLLIKYDLKYIARKEGMHTYLPTYLTLWLDAKNIQNNLQR